MVEGLLTDEQFRRLILDAPDVVAVLEADLTIRFVTRSVLQALGFSSEEMVGSNLREYLDEREVQSASHKFGGSRNEEAPNAPSIFEVRALHKEGSWRHFDAAVVDRLQDPDFGGIVVYLHDVTERRAQEKTLAHQALHDPLTGLPNRTLFLDRLSQTLGAAAREGEPVAVLFLDLDNFKSINDSLGHLAGDRLLVSLGQRVQGCLRPGDTIARLGGDEFAVLIEKGAREAERIAERIKEALCEPLESEGGAVRISASVGMATSLGVHGDVRPEELLRAADAAMYRVKRGKACLDFGDESKPLKGGMRLGFKDHLRW